MIRDKETPQGRWALILGASSGFGEACALELASLGMNIFGVHLDTRSTLPKVQQIVDKIETGGQVAHYFNVNAADPNKRSQVMDRISEELKAKSSGSVEVVIHSLAFGSLRPYIPMVGEEGITKGQMEMTLDVMANSLVYWTQDLMAGGHIKRGGKIFAMTSAGSQRAVSHYGAVSAAKASLEAHVRQLALELAPSGICVNAIRAGVTDTPALRKIPGHVDLMSQAQAKNPQGRMTSPTDVAKGIGALCNPNAYWITGNIIGADGGEDITGF